MFATINLIIHSLVIIVVLIFINISTNISNIITTYIAMSRLPKLQLLGSYLYEYYYNYCWSAGQEVVGHPRNRPLNQVMHSAGEAGCFHEAWSWAPSIGPE